MLVEWLMAVILSFNSAWTPRTCSEGDERCVTGNVEREARLEELATAIVTSSEREGLDPLMVASIISRESSFLPEPCGRRVPLDRVISREPVEGDSGKEILTWECPNRRGGPICERPIWDVSERDGYLHYSTCSANEVGFMQIVPWTSWAQAGAVIPGTERAVPGATLNGEEGARTVDLCGIPDGDWEIPDSSDTPILQLTLPGDNDRDRETWSAIITEITPTDTGVALHLLKPLPESLADFSDFVLATGLPRASRERRTLMLDTTTNIAIGCAELADHRDSNNRANRPWWDWVGAYNTGTVHGDTSHGYARRIVARYVEFCDRNIPQADGTTKKLSELWEGCAAAEEENGGNPERR